MVKARIPKTSSKLAVAYLRVSTEEQSLGPRAQRAAIERWALANGVTIAAWHVDRGVSGGAPLDKRPELMAAFEAMREHAAGLLLVAKRDRLARDVMIAGMLERLAERQGAAIRCADGTGDGAGPEGELMRGIVDLFAQYERAVIRARTKAALAAKKARGELTGSAPLGAKRAADGVHLELHEAEQNAVSYIRALRADGLPLRAIVDRLNAEQVPARGSRWHLTSVVRVLGREQQAA